MGDIFIGPIKKFPSGRIVGYNASIGNGFISSQGATKTEAKANLISCLDAGLQHLRDHEPWLHHGFGYVIAVVPTIRCGWMVHIQAPNSRHRIESERPSREAAIRSAMLDVAQLVWGEMTKDNTFHDAATKSIQDWLLPDAHAEFESWVGFQRRYQFAVRVLGMEGGVARGVAGQGPGIPVEVQANFEVEWDRYLLAV